MTRSPSVLPLDQADDAGAADALDDLVDAEGAQQLGDALGGAVDVVAQLGVFVEVAAPGGDLGVKVGNSVDDRHAVHLACRVRGASTRGGLPQASRDLAWEARNGASP